MANTTAVRRSRFELFTWGAGRSAVRESSCPSNEAIQADRRAGLTRLRRVEDCHASRWRARHERENEHRDAPTLRDWRCTLALARWRHGYWCRTLGARAGRVSSSRTRGWAESGVHPGRTPNRAGATDAVHRTAQVMAMI